MIIRWIDFFDVGESISFLIAVRLIRLIRLISLIKVRNVVFLVNLGITLAGFNIFNLLCMQNNKPKLLKTILTITGSDSTGGSGVQADIRTIATLGGYAVSAVTSVTVQNTLGIQAFYDLPAEIVRGQIEAIINDMQPDTVKVGMIRTIETLGVVVDALLKYRPHHIIYDPIVTASNGDRLMTDDVITQIRCRLLPLCSLVILREGEAERIFDCSSLKGEGRRTVRSFVLDDPLQHGLANSVSSARVNDVKNLKIGVPKEFFGEGLNSEVRKAIEEAIETYKKLGAEIVEVSLPNSKYALSAYYIIALAEASSNLARYDGVSYGMRVPADNLVDMSTKTRTEGFGPEVQRRILLGTYVLSAGYYDAYYLKALKVRRLIKNEFDEAFSKVDLILTPTAPNTSYKFGEKANDPLAMYLEDICTVPANLAGIPGISIPAGMSSSNLPIGLQLLGPAMGEETLLRAAFTFEQARPDCQLVAPTGEVSL